MHVLGGGPLPVHFLPGEIKRFAYLRYGQPANDPLQKDHQTGYPDTKVAGPCLVVQSRRRCRILYRERLSPGSPGTQVEAIDDIHPEQICQPGCAGNRGKELAVSFNQYGRRFASNTAIATSAGMVLRLPDRADIRFILHCQMSWSSEWYKSQLLFEPGRSQILVSRSHFRKHNNWMANQLRAFDMIWC